MLPDVDQFSHVLRDGRCVDDERVVGISRNEVRIVLVMDGNAFLFQLFRQF